MTVKRFWHLILAMTMILVVVPPVFSASLKRAPLTGTYVTSGFGMRTHPITGKHSFHNGVDLGASLNQSVTALYDGVVKQAGWRGLLGNAVEIFHPKLNLLTIYGHLNSVSVTKGQKVKAGKTIGGAGTTGRSTGVHLHVTMKNATTGAPVNPLTVMRGSRPTTILANSKVRARTARAASVIASASAAKPKAKPVDYKGLLAKAQQKLKLEQTKLDDAKTLVAEAQKKADTFEMLYKEGAVSRNDFESKAAALKIAQGTLSTLEGRIATISAETKSLQEQIKSGSRVS
jgi:hypothetical protein